MSNPLFILIISGTETIRHPGVSAAGASHEMLKYTAALDAEFIYHGETKTLDSLPVSPDGIVSPALITKACLNLLDIPVVVINAGSHIKPKCPYIQVRSRPAADISTGQAMTREEVEELIRTGNELAQEFIRFDELIIAECVVGGTTTAYGLLTALGYDCGEMVSSSLPQGNHQLKQDLVKQGLEKASEIKDRVDAIAAVGDPMQALTLGLLEASQQQVTLAGGTQMLALAAAASLRGTKQSRIKISASPWVVNDSSAKFTQLHKLVCPEIKVSYLNSDWIASHTLAMTESLPGYDIETVLTRYNEGHVKEGVGMGALLERYFASMPLPTMC